MNLVTEDLLTAMNISAANFPSAESEITAAGLHPAASKQIRVPRVAEAEASLECILHSQQPLGAYTLFIGQVVMFHIADRLLGDRLHPKSPVGSELAPKLKAEFSKALNLLLDEGRFRRHEALETPENSFLGHESCYSSISQPSASAVASIMDLGRNTKIT